MVESKKICKEFEVNKILSLQRLLCRDTGSTFGAKIEQTFVMTSFLFVATKLVLK